jgi:hypothetical protein
MIVGAIQRLTGNNKLDTSLDPRAVDELGAVIANILQANAVEAVVCWDGDDEAALAQVVGCRLDVRVIRAQENLGLLTLDRPPTEAVRVALIATRWGGYRPLAPLWGLVTNAGLEPVIAVSVVAGGPELHEGFPALVLEHM